MLYMYATLVKRALDNVFANDLITSECGIYLSAVYQEMVKKKEVAFLRVSL